MTRSWVFWRYEQTPGRTKPAKVPCSPMDGRKVSLHDEDRFTDYATAQQACRRFGGAGVGLILPVGIAAVDLDAAIVDSKPTAWAAQVLRAMPSYTEISPSGAGLHIVVKIRTKIPVATKWNIPAGGAVEVFGSPHFLTWTGQRWPDTPTTLADGTEFVSELLQRIEARRQAKTPIAPATPAPSIPADDERLLRIAYASRKGQAIAKLMAGDLSAYGGDASRADFALASHLAFWTGRNADRVRRIMLSSSLRREKWHEPHTASGDDYLALTVMKACDTCRTVFGQDGKSTGVGR